MISSLVGLWLFTGLFYQGQNLPLPNPDLKIYYHFEDSGSNTLYYHREGESGFCQRKASFVFAKNRLSQKVYWTHPENASWCAQDPDMRLGSESTTFAEVKDGKFYLAVTMGEEFIYYIWEPVGTMPSPN